MTHISLHNLDRAALEQVAVRAIIDAIGGEHRVEAYHAVMVMRRPVTEVAISLGVSRLTLRRWVADAEEYIGHLRALGLIPAAETAPNSKH